MHHHQNRMEGEITMTNLIPTLITSAFVVGLWLALHGASHVLPIANDPSFTEFLLGMLLMLPMIPLLLIATSTGRHEK